ncbi:MAG: primosomal protein N' [Chloroflexota bacterium]|nr:primosomal protein N' [Chloroflexota bacterium]
MNYAEVAVNSPGAQRNTFCYAVPSFMPLQVGHIVEVPFGPKVAQGIVIGLSETPSVDDTREIAGIIDPRPIVSPTHVKLAQWISESYLSPLFDAVALSAPPAFERRVITYLSLIYTPDESVIESFTQEQRSVLDIVASGTVDSREIEKAIGKRRAAGIINHLVRRKLIDRSYQLGPSRVRPKTAAYLRLTIDNHSAKIEADRLRREGRAYKQAGLIDFLRAGTALPVDLVKRFGFTSSIVAELRKKGLISVERVRVYRDPTAHRSFQTDMPPILIPAQQSAWGEIEPAIESSAPGRPPSIFLLHGVAGSGKTEVYLRALERTVAAGKKAIVLVPEIALTPQTVARFASRFPGRVAVLHSKLSIGEQFDEWWRIKEGEFDVVIGPRGAVFAPQPDLGLIVVDEEHEWTYKQHEQSPRYHARDVAIELARLTGSVVILGSATPDVVSYRRAQSGEYRLLELPERIAKGEKEVGIVDLRRELKAGNRSIFSRALSSAIARALADREQVILFLNRRGSATFVQCRDCGHVMRCRRCDVSMTYHSAGEDLVCHQCNNRLAVPSKCPECGGNRIKFLGLGTQRVEEEIALAFPQARLLRWDRDAVGKKHSHEEILDSFMAHEADILIGTQMIAKGLDFPLVSVVGVINADVNLNLPDFRSAERTYQLLSQVAGRAGRGSLAGQVIVQSYSPEHYAVECVAEQDYACFYEKEIALRRQYHNPPFSRLARLLFTDSNNDTCRVEAEAMYRRLQGEADVWGMAMSLIGPAPAFVRRLRGRYRWQIILRCENPVGLLSKLPLPPRWIIDIDPVSLL